MQHFVPRKYVHHRQDELERKVSKLDPFGCQGMEHRIEVRISAKIRCPVWE
jgi:hypothetical protein